MKKKPPPGATLIARLKEQRLAREAELARRRQEPDADAEPGTPPEVVDVPEKEPVTPAADKSRVIEEKPPIKPEPIETTIVVESAPEPRPLTVMRKGQQQDLLRREINIGDLRPTVSDYFVLTDEIRLAGRFAAVGLIAQGLRLACLRNDEIYKDHYQTFEDYCRKEHQMSATYAYRLIRMAEMAEHIAEIEQKAIGAHPAEMPDPFEVMISLGHRHIMALLPLEIQTAQELLVKGIPVTTDGTASRVPIAQATEKQIRAALKTISPGEGKGKAVPKKALASEKQLIPALSKFVEMLEDWAVWLDGDPPPELEAARTGRGPLLNRLAKRFRAASDRIAASLENENK